MGRRIYDQKNNFVYKYVFSIQPSQLGEISSRLGIGKYTAIPARDRYRLTLTPSQAARLESVVAPHKAMLTIFKAQWDALYHPLERLNSFRMADPDSVTKFFSRWQKRQPDILFWLMAEAIGDHSRLFFEAFPTSRALILTGDF